jgi:S-disulfanyl-L-cysteine oxidoreductase SoxD
MGACTMRISFSCARGSAGSKRTRPPLLVFVLILGASLSAQSPTYHLGRTPTPEEVKAWDIAISPDGHELPPGHGTAKEGRDLFIEKGCSQCHGRNGEGGKAPTLIVMKGMPTAPGRPMPGMDMGIQAPGLMAVSAPFATTMWDYINRGMPLGREGSLKPDEVYSLVAFLLFRNDVIKSEDEVLDNQTLPKLKMPNLSGYTEHPEWKHATPRLSNYP